MAFDREKLRQYMKAKGITQTDLAYLAGRDVRTIRRWLSPQQRLTPKHVNQICQALDVSPEQFDPEANETNTSEHNQQVGARVSAAAANGYLLLKKQYGVSYTQLIELAPVMFSIIAKRAFGLSSRLEQDLADAEQIQLLTGVDSQIDPFDEHFRKIKNAKASEESGMLFGEAKYDGGHDNFLASPANLFCTELTKLTKDFEDPPTFAGPGYCPTSRGFPFPVAILDEITCGDNKLKELILLGEINLGLMDEHLWHPENNDERTAWLKQQALNSKARHKIEDEAWRKANPKQAKARDELRKRLAEFRGKLTADVVELKQTGDQ